jgi:DNA-binding CsgD family transcriptional regulator
LRIARESLDVWSRAMALTSLGDLLRSRGDAEEAGALYEEALPLFRELDPLGRAVHGLLHNLAYIALARDLVQRAAELFVESAEQYRRIGADRRGVAECVIGLACVAVRNGKPELAARLFGSADVALAEMGTTVSASNLAAQQCGLALVRAALDARRLAVASSAGRRLSLAEALQQARGLTELAVAAPSASLTQREAEVARLIARGLTNRQVADQLVITEKTAKNHAQRVLDKLGVSSRAQVAAGAGELGLRD